MNAVAEVASAVKSVGDGLFQIDQNLLKKLIRTEPMSDVYHVEQTPFARGKFATVRKARHRESGVEYAAKVIRKRRRSQDFVREIAHEIAVLLQCADSPRVVRLHEVYDARTEMILILELAAGGELQHVLDTDECLSEGEARRVMRQILEGLSFLHAKNIAHLDLKPQNLLFVSQSADSDIKLCDFGISRIIEPGVEVREILGTPDYVAPEILGYEPISLATDIWSVGVLAYVLLCGYSPFGGESKQETFLNISQCNLSFPQELFSDVSNLAKDFIRSTLVIDPRSRPGVLTLLEHPWLAGNEPLLPSLTEPTPVVQHKSYTTITDTPKSQRKAIETDDLNDKFSDTFSCIEPPPCLFYSRQSFPQDNRIAC